MKREDTPREHLRRVRSQLALERSSFESHWRMLSDYIQPMRARWYVNDGNRGDRKTKNIIDSTGTMALRTLQAGLMTGITSPARPWFRLTHPDPELAAYGPVKEYLHIVTQRMRTLFLQSNLYKTLPTVYGDIGCFGTSAMAIESMPGRFFTESFPIGSYFLGANRFGKVDTFLREFQMTVRQIVETFGVDREDPTKINWDNISVFVKEQWDMGNYQTWVEVCHLVEPNKEYDPARELNPKFKKFKSCYFEKGSTRGSDNYMRSAFDDNKTLRASGFDLFPILAGRWETTAEDVYGTNCPAITALGDIRALQLMQKRKSQAIDKMVNPPMVAHPSLKQQKATILPGDTTYFAERNGTSGFRPAHEVRLDLGALREDISMHQDRISRAFYEDLFLMIASSDRRQITAREIEERHEEKLLALGPTLERMDEDINDPLIDHGFMHLEDNEMIPPPPEEIQGQDLKVEYVSIMAEAQKRAGIGSIERFVTFVSNMAQVDPNALDKLDSDETLDVYGDMMSVPPGILRDADEVEEIREQRAQAQQQQQQQEAMAQGAQTVKELSQAKTGDENILSQLTQAGSPLAEGAV